MTKKKNALVVIGSKMLDNVEGKIDLRITKNDLVTVKVHEREKEIKSELDSVRQALQETAAQRTSLAKQIKILGQGLAEVSYAKKAAQLKQIFQEISGNAGSKGITTRLVGEVARPREKKAYVGVTFEMAAAGNHFLALKLKPVKASKELLSTVSKVNALGSKYDTLRDQEDKLSMEYNDIPRLEREAQAEVTKGLLEKAGLTTD